MLKSKIFQFAIIFCIVFGTALAAFADTIRLKDGSVIKGRIIAFRDGQFTVLIGDGSRSRQMTFFSDEISAIEFDSSAVALNTGSTSPILPTRPSATPAPTPIVRPSNTPAIGNDTKIIVGQTNSPTTTPTPASTPIFTPQPTPSQTPNASPRPQPIRLNLKVLADNTSNGWTNAGWVVRKGQKIRITGTGRVSLGNGNYTTPTGLSSLTDPKKLMPREPTGELIAVIGDDNNDFIPIGASKEFTATRDGALFLGINEDKLDDNSGSFEIVVEIDPGVGN